MNAIERVKRIKKSIRGKDNYQPYGEHRIMKEYSIGYNELMSFPYEKFLEFSKIIALEEKEQEKERKRMEEKSR